MLLQFSDTTNKSGIIQLLSKRTGTQNSNSYSLLEKTVDINLALANYFIIANQNSGRWQVDDTNHTDYPIIYANIVSGQQDYSFTVDENDNQILDIYKVRIKDTNGKWWTLKQRDLQDGNDEPLNSTTTGLPTEYDLTANGIFLNDIPNFTQDNSLEVYISRAGSYFVSTDTDKVAGIPEIFHEYLVIRPAYFYCLEKGLPQANDYKIILYGLDGRGGMEKSIETYHANRNRDEKRRVVTGKQNNR